MLHGDGTFEKWGLTELQGETVSLNGALFVDDRDGTIDSKSSDGDRGGWKLHRNNTSGQLTLSAREDLGFYFEKALQRKVPGHPSEDHRSSPPT